MYHVDSESGTKVYNYQVWKLDDCGIPTLVREASTRAFSAADVKQDKARQYGVNPSRVKVRLAR